MTMEKGTYNEMALASTASSGTTTDSSTTDSDSTTVKPEKCGDCIEKQKAIFELQPPTDNWETYADRLYDLAYLSGYNDGLIAKGNQDNNV